MWTGWFGAVPNKRGVYSARCKFAKWKNWTRVVLKKLKLRRNGKGVIFLGRGYGALCLAGRPPKMSSGGEARPIPPLLLVLVVLVPLCAYRQGLRSGTPSRCDLDIFFSFTRAKQDKKKDTK